MEWTSESLVQCASKCIFFLNDVGFLREEATVVHLGGVSSCFLMHGRIRERRYFSEIICILNCRRHVSSWREREGRSVCVLWLLLWLEQIDRQLCLGRSLMTLLCVMVWNHRLILRHWPRRLVFVPDGRRGYGVFSADTCCAWWAGREVAGGGWKSEVLVQPHRKKQFNSKIKDICKIP